VWATDPTRLCEAREPVLVEGIATGNPTEDELRERFERGEFAGKRPQDVLRSTPTAFWPWVRTGADGAFVLGGLEDRAYSLRTMAEDTLLSAEVAGVAAGSRSARLVLDASALFDEVRGVVVTRAGTPVANARIVVQLDTQSVAGRTQHGQAITSARTGADGTFTLPKVPKERAYFRIDGDDILPSEPGRGMPGGIFALAGGKPNDLRLEVRSRLHVQVELLDPTRADRIGVLDADGRSVHLTVFHGRGRRDADRLELAEGRSPVFVVPDHATTLVLFAGDEEVAREPLQLRPGSVNTLRL
jgi:hypothetical protein